MYTISKLLDRLNVHTLTHVHTSTHEKPDTEEERGREKERERTQMKNTKYQKKRSQKTLQTSTWQERNIRNSFVSTHLITDKVSKPLERRKQPNFFKK